ncbi:hypothetical protein OG809_30220 [Kribbella soli]
MTDLVQRVQALDETTAIEAAQLLSSALGVSRDSVTQADLDDRTDVADLARILLVVAADDPETTPLVEEALAGAGHKQLVLGGAELLILAGLAVTALHICITKGATKKSKITSVEKKADGTEKITIQEETTFGVSARLGTLIKTILESATGGRQ